MGAGALTICHSKAAVQIREDMKRMVQLPTLRGIPGGARGARAEGGGVFGVPLLELREQGLVKDGVPLVVRSMVRFLRDHALHQEGLFRVNGNVRAVEVLKQRLESGEDVNFMDEADVCTVASLLKQYVRDLPEGLVDSTVQNALIQQHQQSSEDGFCSDLKDILRRLPDQHYSLLRYLCVFLAQVDQRHQENRMTALNLATVFGPNVFHVSSGFDGIQEQNICNKIMAKLIQNHVVIFNHNHDECQEPKEEHIVFQDHSTEPIGDAASDVDRGDIPDPLRSNLIIVKEAKDSLCNGTDPIGLGRTPSTLTPPTKMPKNTPIPRKKEAAGHSAPDKTNESKEPSREQAIATHRKKKVRKARGEPAAGLQAVPVPNRSTGLPHLRPLPLSPAPPGHRSPRVMTCSTERMAVATAGAMGDRDISAVKTRETLSSSQEEDGRPISPFYMSHLSPAQCRPDLNSVLEKTIRSAVEQHLFDVRMCENSEGLTGDSESIRCRSSPPVNTTARQRRRYQREQEEAQRQLDRSGCGHKTNTSKGRSSSLREGDVNKENIPASGGFSGASLDSLSMCEESGRGSCQASHQGLRHRSLRPWTTRHGTGPQSPMVTQVGGNQDTLKECVGIARAQGRAWTNNMDSLGDGSDSQRKDSSLPLTASWSRLVSMKIQEQPSSCETVDRRGVVGRSSDQERGESCEDVPRLDLSALTEDKTWGDSPFFSAPFLDFKSIFQSSFYGEPVPAYSSWQRESMDSDEACISPQVGGRLIRQLIEEDSDPMLSPRFHAYGHCQQYLDDTEVPPSPPNSHSFSSRRRSSSLGSCGDDDREELTSAQLSKKIHSLKRKIRKYEEKFEEERKYRPSHSDKADNPEVLKWMNELEKLKKDLKEHKLHKSEEDLPTMTRQRSNTLPKSFGSQLEKKPQQEKVPKPPVESTLEVVQIKLQEKRKEVGRPEDIKDMTREQISAEKVALQKALLYYEGIHGRPVTKMERQIMKPLYDRYRLVKQILCRASTIPVIGSPSSKRRGPLLQPIIEGEPALFFDDIKEEEDGSEDDSESTNKPQSPVMVRSDFGMIGFLDQLEEETDGFISPVDDLSPSKNNSDMRLSNLHSATMPELVEQLQEAREEKKRIRKNLREFEEQFMRQNGRNVQKEDRSPLAVEYNEYKHIKAKLRLLEVLISKRDVSKFI
ncbi:protein FAM13A isoform X3 [Esox lucius]|uniref:protein FAM13A isoform X3 n=1 Tax=Esox lucius TaxID=8010 RepID=UPI00147730A5|nr:protein FAM13A isoform X3 [Esox lucius]